MKPQLTSLSMQVILVMSVIVFSLTHQSISDDYDNNDEDYDEYSNTNATYNGTLQFTRKLVNVTKDPGTLVKFLCEVQNTDTNNTTSKVKFRWKHNEVKVEPEGRFKIRNKYKDNIANSTLTISKLDFFDQGMIECIINDGIHRLSSRSFLFVTPEPHKYGSTDMNTLRMGFNKNDGFSEITTFLPNTIAKLNEDSSNLFTTSNDNSKSFSTSMQFDLTPNGDILENAPIYNSSEPFCQIYKGRRCKQYLANKYVFVQPPYTQKEIEDKLDDAFLVVSQSNDLSQACNQFAQPSICFSAFPLCLDHKQVNLYQVNHQNDLVYGDKNKLKNIKTTLTNFLRRICRDECLLLENELCSKEYSLAKRHVILGKILELEVCELLPLQHDSSSKLCLSLGVGELNLNKDEKCYWDSGKLYRGNQDTTASGKKCIRWAHQFRVLVSDYAELAGHNYCRNPGEMESEPFCFVEQNKIEKCGISKCVYIFGIYVGAFVGGIALIIIIIILYWYKKRKNKLSRNLQTIGLPQASKNIYGNPGPSSPMEMSTLLPTHNQSQRSHGSNKSNFQAVPQYTYKEVRFLEELGEGAFGKVYKGELKTKMGKIFVAVKSLKENASAKTQADFQREIELISELKHPNVICLLGIVVKQEPLCMLFEYMSEGDLHEFLIANSPEEGKCLTHDQFLDIAIQIGQGMDYLSGNHYVHRDLAARNCLVSKDLVVKISDFGLSRDMYSCDYYRVQSKSLLPVRWMPPESILYGKFTTESDVWSYGVVLWEIYSYGLQPYYGYNNQEVINMIRSRKLLPCPDACPSYSYALMVECWAEQANRRPNFSEIVHRLKVWKQSGSMTGAYFKSSTTPQRHGHGSKSSHTSGSQTPANENKSSLTWERSCHGPNSCRLNDSQSSLTSKSSIGNTTQSTNISSEIRKEKKNRRNIDSLERPKNTIIATNENGDKLETKITL